MGKRKLAARYLSGKHSYYPPSEYCKECGGVCCKSFPGLFASSDFNEPVIDNVKALLKLGLVVIDGTIAGEYCEAIYGVRPAMQQERNLMISNGHGNKGDCVFLSEDGCILPPDAKPAVCRLLTAGKGERHRCGMNWKTIDTIGNTWYEYDADLEALWLEVEERSE